MAQLPPDGVWLVQSVDNDVIVVNRHTQVEVVRFDATNADLTALAMRIINDSPLLTDEQKCFAYFWSGYYHAHLRGAILRGGAEDHQRQRADEAEARVQKIVLAAHAEGHGALASVMAALDGDQPAPDRGRRARLFAEADAGLQHDQPAPKQQDTPGLFCGNCHGPVSERFEHMAYDHRWNCLPYSSGRARSADA